MTNGLKTRRKFELKDFKGFDFSSSPLNISSSRGYRGRNFIFENGSNRKRKGYEEILRIEREENGITVYPKINGIFEFSINQTNFLICYAGKHFYKIENQNSVLTYTDITFSSTYAPCQLNPDLLQDNRLSIFKNQDTVYFVGAGKFISFKRYQNNFELRLVQNNEDTFVPTTTLNIQPDGESEQTFQPFEEANILSDFRINTFSPRNIESNEEITYTVDSGYIDTTKRVLIDINAKINGEIRNVQMKNVNFDNELFLNIATSIYGTINSQSGKITIKNTNNIFEEIYGLTVRFSCGPNSMLEKINTSKIGVLFGVNGRRDRLFLAKNDIKINEDYYSESDDFTYFKENCASSIGSENSKIMAYNLLNDGTLAIQKEYKNGEAGIFYRTSVYDVDFNTDGTISYIKTYFPIKTGTIGEGVISSYSLGNLGDDKLFLSQNGVFALSTNTNNVVTDRYSKERSNYINGKLLKHSNLEEAVSTVFDNKYFLAIDGYVYIADPRFKSTDQNTQNDTFNYEWWLWDNIPARVWQIVSNKLCFGTDDGRICCFDSTFTDKTYQTTQNGDILIDYIQNKITFNESLNVKNDNIIRFSNNVFANGINQNEIIKVENDKIFVNNDKMPLLKNGRKVLCLCQSQTLTNMTEFSISNIDFQQNCFELYLENQKISLSNTDFDLLLCLKNEKLKIVNEQNNFRLCYNYNDTILSLVQTDISSNFVLAKILNENVVCSEWFTPMLDFGKNEVSKTLLKLSITTEPSTNGKLVIGYRTKDFNYEINGKGISSFSFDNLDFSNFSFLTTFANSYTIDLKEDFNYIQFYFKSDSTSECVIENVTIIYKENRFNKGVE